MAIAEVIDCGDGSDTAEIDYADLATTTNCESIDVIIPSMAGSVAVVGGVMQYTAVSDAANNVTVTPIDATTVLVRDSALTTLTRGGGRRRAGAERSDRCGVLGYDGAQVDTGTGNDTITHNGSIVATLIGGPGNDTVRGGDANDTFDPGPGGAGDADLLDGRGGTDFVSYVSRVERRSS